MEERCKKIYRFIKGKKSLNFKADDLGCWKETKKVYDDYGYQWVNLDVMKNSKKIKKIDEENSKKYFELKQNENNLRKSLKNIEVPVVKEPPSPSNYKRYKMYKRWNSGSNFFNVTLASIELLERYQLRPCIDYNPQDVMKIYLEKKREEVNNVRTLPQYKEIFSD